MVDVCKCLPSVKYVKTQLLKRIKGEAAERAPSAISSNSPILENIPAVAIAVPEHAGRRGCWKGIEAQELKRMRCKQNDDQEDQRD